MHRTNNFDALRLYFAATVVLAHCYDLSQKDNLSWIPHVVNSRIAVEGFFAMSGYLIMGSYTRSSSFKSYIQKRALRILPGYWVALLLTLVLGVVLSSLPSQGLLSSVQTWYYVLADLSFLNFLHPTMPGLFEHNPGGSAVNGALWTIKIEVAFYLAVPAISVLSRRLGRWQTPTVLFFLSVIYHGICEHFSRDSLAKQLPGQLCFFAVGILVYEFSSVVLRDKKWMIAITVCACAAYLIFGGLILEALAVPLAVFCVAFFLPHIQGPTKYGDFSYGIYVLHFPIIQGLIALGLFDAHPWIGLEATLIVVALLAVASWKLIESPTLQLRSKNQV